MSNQRLKSLIQTFAYDEKEKPSTSNSTISHPRISKPKPKPKPKPTTNSTTGSSNIKLPNLNPSLSSNLHIIFVGFNPGIQSSIQQHHYAHHSNLFWKLFNQSQLLQKICDTHQIPTSSDDKYLHTLLQKGSSHLDDWGLIKYGIGFTDLVLRCTKRAEELSMVEKLENVPRLLQEFKSSKVENVVIVGKGIWEMIVKYIAQEIKVKLKLNKVNFIWGKVEVGNDEIYNSAIEWLNEKLERRTIVWVFPSTSGLVGSMSYANKLQLWNNLVDHIS
ncbi:thp1 [[Candida] subhashii]|uniref:Thp1 n=1 Tax=[Candida] subhashii TaxID=561895 RepID=A0A8J5UL62_9ASCO|nr:thp1 [[Candida] subhashii]KAG7665748.1 thp1 [[Candida] subhashii]